MISLINNKLFKEVSMNDKFDSGLPVMIPYFSVSLIFVIIYFLVLMRKGIIFFNF